MNDERDDLAVSAFLCIFLKNLVAFLSMLCVFLFDDVLLHKPMNGLDKCFYGRELPLSFNLVCFVHNGVFATGIIFSNVGFA